jgi:hypothetical protein
MEENSFMASRERDDAMAGLLKRSLAGEAGAADGCPAPDALAAYFERSLDADETARVDLHLSQCGRCREQLAALGRAEEAAAPATATPPKAARASGIWDWRWLAPVAAVLILTAVWATRRPELTRIAEHSRQSPAAVPAPQSAQQPIQHVDRQPPQQDKQQLASRVAAPAPSAPPAPPAPAPAANFAAGVGMAASADNSRSTNSMAPKSASPDELSKKAARQEGATDQAPNAPAVTSETLTIQTESSPIASIAPESSPHSNGAVGGVAGGASGAPSARAQTAKEKEAPALVSTFRARPEIVTENQAGELSSARIITTSDSNILWRIAGGGFIERSEDGGATWNGTLPNPNAHFVAGSAPGAKICWLVGHDGIILLTEDASNWRVIPPPVREDFVAISARSASSATVTTADGRKFTTTNQGESWTAAK